MIYNRGILENRPFDRILYIVGIYRVVETGCEQAN